MEPWKTLSREMLLDLGKFLKIEKHTVGLPDGRVINDWPWVIAPDYINVVALTPEKEFICFRQVKYAVDGTSLSVVGGYIEPGELPLEAAKRELKEEAGYESKEWIFLGEFTVDANRGAGVGNFFLALDAVRVPQVPSDDLEEQKLLLMGMDEVLPALQAGEFKVLSWTAAIALALVYLNCK